MYNLGHMYFYGEKVKTDLDKSIELLVQSSISGFHFSKVLLILALIKKITIPKISKEEIEEEMQKYKNIKGVLKLSTEIFESIQKYKLNNDINYEFVYFEYENKDFTYNIYKEPISTSNFFSEREKKIKEIEEKNKNIRTINQYFYEGFGF